MKVSTSEQGEVLVIALQGKIMGSDDAFPFYQAVNAAVADNRKQVVLDLAGLEWMNSTGLGMLIAGSARLRNVDGLLKLARPNNTVNNLINLNKLNLIFGVYATLEEAAASYK